MIRSLWTGTTGMNAQQLSIDVIANNLANVSTTGFKKSTTEFKDLLYEMIKVPGSQTSANTESPTGIQVGIGVRPDAVSKIFTQGDLIGTENELDVAIDGPGFFEVELPNGNSAFTRAGNFKRDSTGQITTANGYPILPALVIPDGSRDIVISETGVVSAVIGDDTDSTEIGNLELTTFTNNQGLRALGDNLFQETAASGIATPGVPGDEGYGVLIQTYLEGSNVNIVSEMALLITTQRAYEINSKTIQTSDEMMQATVNLA
ncbi:flagellar basal-body rod protein FlgG [Desulfofustis glycolicus]|uniref:Flagellar basal-body rod protein FlgG n=1 Tax=Desulfofustis glycolicus DSM 9705 TaxID=1121409 RepID=A0A1M5U125_9BACT|nr:flagellar basal-body rod protein FlgG [Desulfofustis glycolicus]MCB2214724.1 flagellar basal-body rod protein FlgG [Desulfobulbaceae bacterium]SHH56556.1 flagellar basal-body rod protein FlgG [Desulfofustis glycolicus DSM 9705]